MRWQEKIDFILIYEDGASITLQGIPFWGMHYRHRKKFIRNRKYQGRAVKICISGEFYLDTERMDYLLKYERQVLHPVLRKGVWVNGIKLRK